MFDPAVELGRKMLEAVGGGDMQVDPEEGGEEGDMEVDPGEEEDEEEGRIAPEGEEPNAVQPESAPPGTG